MRERKIAYNSSKHQRYMQLQMYGKNEGIVM